MKIDFGVVGSLAIMAKASPLIQTLGYREDKLHGNET